MLTIKSGFASDRFFALALFLSCLPAHAHMPLNTEDAGTTAKGGYQFEQYFYRLLQVGQNSTDSGSVSSGQDYEGSSNAKAFPFAFSGGLTDNIDLQFTSTYYLQPLGSFSLKSLMISVMYPPQNRVSFKAYLILWSVASDLTS